MVGGGGGDGCGLGDGADGSWLVPGDATAFLDCISRASVDRRELKQLRMRAHLDFRRRKRHTSLVHVVQVVKEIAAKEG